MCLLGLSRVFDVQGQQVILARHIHIFQALLDDRADVFIQHLCRLGESALIPQTGEGSQHTLHMPHDWWKKESLGGDSLARIKCDEKCWLGPLDSDSGCIGAESKSNLTKSIENCTLKNLLLYTLLLSS